jgi:hypothetical protein
MNPENNTQETLPKESFIAPLHKVTPLSKILAAVVFILLPFVGAYVGYELAGEKTAEISVVNTENKIAIEKDTDLLFKSARISESLEMPKNNYLLSARTEIFKGYYAKKVIPNDEVLGFVSEGEIVTCDAFVITEGDVSLFYEYDEQGTSNSVTQQQLPYTILITSKTDWPQIWKEVLTDSSIDKQKYAVITNYEMNASKDRDTCEPIIDGFIPFTTD